MQSATSAARRDVQQTVLQRRPARASGGALWLLSGSQVHRLAAGGWEQVGNAFNWPWPLQVVHDGNAFRTAAHAQLWRLEGDTWVADGPAGRQVFDAVVHDGRLHVLVAGSSSGVSSEVLVDAGSWTSIWQSSSPAASLSATAHGLVINSAPLTVLDASGAQVFDDCRFGGSAVAYRDDIISIGRSERYHADICALGRATPTTTELALDFVGDSAAPRVVARITVHGGSAPARGVVGVDGAPAGSCTIETLAPISATAVRGSCEIAYTRDLDVEFTARYFGAALSGGDGWLESTVTHAPVRVSGILFANSFE
jgi:hypothetical protein